MEEIFDRKLLFFLPFYIFSHEKQLPEYESDETKLRNLMDEYRRILSKLDELQETGDIDAFIKNAICATITHVLALIAENYQNVREGVEHIMRGKVIDYEAKTIRNKALDEGRKEGRKEGRNEERQLALAETEERAKDMLRDRMELPLVEKYTHLSMPRIQELARGLGML